MGGQNVLSAWKLLERLVKACATLEWMIPKLAEFSTSWIWRISGISPFWLLPFWPSYSYSWVSSTDREPEDCRESIPSSAALIGNHRKELEGKMIKLLARTIMSAHECKSRLALMWKWKKSHCVLLLRRMWEGVPLLSDTGCIYSQRRVCRASGTDTVHLMLGSWGYLSAVEKKGGSTARHD